MDGLSNYVLKKQLISLQNKTVDVGAKQSSQKD